MKAILLLCMIALSSALFAQKKPFVRVYDLSGKKIHKGRLHDIADSSLQIGNPSGVVDIAYQKIGKIKTKRSEGHNVLVGALTGLTVGGIVGAATYDPDAWGSYSAADDALAFGVVGIPLGAAIGAATTLLKNSNSYIISGDAAKWMAFKQKATAAPN